MTKKNSGFSQSVSPRMTNSTFNLLQDPVHVWKVFDREVHVPLCGELEDDTEFVVPKFLLALHPE